MSRYSFRNLRFCFQAPIFIIAWIIALAIVNG